MLHHIHKSLVFLLQEALGEKSFTSCEVGFFWKFEKRFETYTLFMDNKGFSTRSKLYFDLASLTKILVTVPCFFSLLSENRICLHSTLDQFFSNSGSWGSTKIIDLINHISGLPAHRLFSSLLTFPEKERFSAIETCIFSEKYENKKQKFLYSDLGYILLGKIIEKVSGMRLDQYWFEKIVIPLNVVDLFFPYQRNFSSLQFVPTGNCPWSGQLLRGVVHDDNCRILGGVCGHAGVFGNSLGVMDLMKKILLIYTQQMNFRSCSSDLLQKYINDEILTRRFGFDTPAKENSSCGDFFSDLTIGHLGFTGTSVWMDIKKEVCIVFLTNRTISDNSLTAIKKLRPKIYNSIMEKVPYKEKSL